MDTTTKTTTPNSVRFERLASQHMEASVAAELKGKARLAKAYARAAGKFAASAEAARQAEAARKCDTTDG